MKNYISGYDFCTGNVNKIMDNIYSDNKNKQITITCLDTNYFIKFYGNPRAVNFYNNYNYIINSSKVIRLLSILKNKKVKYISIKKFMVNFLNKIQNENYNVYIYSKKNNVDLIKAYFNLKYPNLNILGIINDLKKTDDIIKDINNKNVDVLLIANTNNSQSEFILKNIDKLNSKFIISCGSFFEKTKNNEFKFLLKFLKYNINKYFKRHTTKKGYVVGWFYPPQTTAQAISTLKILKNSKFKYDVFTTKSRSFNYSEETNFNIFDTSNVNVFMSDETNPNLWCDLAAKKFLDNEIQYDFFMTRVMPSWSHDVGLQIRESGDNTPWIASFADPMFNSPYVMYDIATKNFDENKANNILSNYDDIFKNSNNKNYECFKSLIDERKKILKVFEQCDMMIYTNEYQAKWMLGDQYNKYKGKCLILPHSYDSDFYLFNEKDDDCVTKFLFIGHTDKFRNLDNFVKAISYVVKDNPIFLKKIRVTLIGNIYEETINLIKKNKLEKIFIINNNLDYIASLDKMAENDVLIHSDAKFKFMNGLNVYFASKLSDYLGANRLIFSLSTVLGPTVDVLNETNHIVCEIDNIDNIKQYIIDIVNGKYNNLRHNNYKYCSCNVVKKYDKKLKKILKRKKCIK